MKYISSFDPEKEHSNYHHTLLQFHATASVKHELFETI